MFSILFTICPYPVVISLSLLWHFYPIRLSHPQPAQKIHKEQAVHISSPPWVSTWKHNLDQIIDPRLTSRLNSLAKENFLILSMSRIYYTYTEGPLFNIQHVFTRTFSTRPFVSPTVSPVPSQRRKSTRRKLFIYLVHHEFRPESTI